MPKFTRPRVEIDGWQSSRSTYRKRSRYRTIDPKEVRKVILASTATKQRSILTDNLATVPGAVGYSSLLYNIDGASLDRTGNSIYVTGTQMSFRATNASVTVPIHLRVLLLKTPQLDSSTWLNEFFEGVNSTSRSAMDFGTGPDANRLMFDVNKAKFSVLFDQIFVIKANVSGDPLSNRLVKTPYIPINSVVKYDDLVQTSQDELRPNFIWVFFHENMVNSAALALTATKFEKLWYKDI